MPSQEAPRVPARVMKQAMHAMNGNRHLNGEVRWFGSKKHMQREVHAMNGNSMDTIPNEMNKLLTNVSKQLTDPPSNDDDREAAVIQPENDVGVGMSGVDVRFKDLTDFYTSAFSPLMSLSLEPPHWTVF